MCLAGYEPLADTCAYCGREEPEDPMLDVVQGVLHCRRCSQTGAAGRLSMPLCADSLAALRHIVYGDPKRLYSFRLGGAALERALRRGGGVYRGTAGARISDPGLLQRASSGADAVEIEYFL